MKLKTIFSLWMFIAIAASYLLAYTPLLLPLIYGVFSLLAYGFYAKDKAAARAGAWRVPENSLHALALLGGWPGAVLAQERLRHKTQKTRFLLVFWLTVVLNVAAFCALHLEPLSHALHAGMQQADALVVNVSDSGQLASVLRELFQYR